MRPFVFFVFVMIVSSESVDSDGSPPEDSGTGCSFSTIQDMVSTEQKVTEVKLEELQIAVSNNNESFSSELENTILQFDVLQETASGYQENVTSEIEEINRDLEELKVLVSALKVKLTPPDVPKDCSDILNNDNASTSGVYTIHTQTPDCREAFKVYCDMETDGGGWTVFQRRMDGSVDFFLDFANYRLGFGNLEGEFWLGNDHLHRLTTQGKYELRVDLSDFSDETKYAVYSSIGIADLNDAYKMALGTYSGNAGDSMSSTKGRSFSTKDKDNDIHGSNCAATYTGAWWYGKCHHSNLNGQYLNGETTQVAKGVVWKGWRGYSYSLKTSEMKIRRLSK